MTIDTKELRFSATNSVRNLALLPSEVLELLDRLEAAGEERDDVAQQLVQSEIGKREISEAHNAVTRRLSVLADENTALRAKIAEMEKQEPYCTAIGPGDWTYQISSPARPGSKLYALPVVHPQLDEIKVTLQRALELGARETWTGARKHRSWEDQREEQQCWNKVWSLLGAQGEEK